MKFYEKLQQADKEKLVEEAYHQELQEALQRHGNRVISLQIENNTDGILETEYYSDGKAHIFKIIIETKLAETFASAVTRAKVLLQVVCYLKIQEDLGKTPPNIVFVGDKDECFTLHTRYLQKYIQRDIVVVNSPSTAFQNNPLLLKEMSEDEELQEQCFIYEINKDFDMLNVIEKMLSLVQNIKLIVPVTEKSISKIFDYFSMRILKRDSKGETKYTPRMQVELFMQLLLNSDECFLHGKKKDTAIFGKNHVPVNADAFRSFTNFYEFNYTMEEKRVFTAIADRLIEDTDRRRKGDFYTPTIWVDESHKLLAENLGDNWKDEYIVWDCAAGTKNLTRDYKFKRLYSSTLEEHDLVISSKYNTDEGYNWAFQYDFLNDDVELFEKLREKKKSGQPLTEQDFEGSILYYKAPGLVRGMLSGQKVLFFINPPYGTSGEMASASTGKEKKSNIAMTKVNVLMKENKIGASSQQLYAQFIYRILKLHGLFENEVKLGLFSPTLFMTGEQFEGLRKVSLKNKFIDGFFFQASEFADVKSNWCISFTLWGEGGTNKHNLKVLFLDADGVKQITSKTLYNLNKKEKASVWVNSLTEGIKAEIETFTMSNAIKITGSSCKIPKNVLAHGFCNVNNIESNDLFVTILPSKSKWHVSYFPIVSENFMRFISYYTARKLITGQYATWINGKDEYMIPNTEHELYKQWEQDCIVYSLFNTSSNQSSLRGIDYNDKKWDIYNHFFFMSRQEILDLAQGKQDRNTINNAVEEDIIEHGKEERFVYTKLQEITLSPDAQAVLDKAKELVIKSFPLREMFNQEHPEYHINTWDAGYYQLVGLLKEYMPEDLKEFRKLYKEFEDRMRPLVYTLNFLRN